MRLTSSILSCLPLLILTVITVSASHSPARGSISNSNALNRRGNNLLNIFRQKKVSPARLPMNDRGFSVHCQIGPVQQHCETYCHCNRPDGQSLKCPLSEYHHRRVFNKAMIAGHDVSAAIDQELENHNSMCTNSCGCAKEGVLVFNGRMVTEEEMSSEFGLLPVKQSRRGSKFGFLHRR